MRIDSQEDLLALEVKILREAEKQLSVALGRISLQCGSSELFLFLQAQAARSFGRGQVLKDVVRMLGRKCSPRPSGPILGIAEDARFVLAKAAAGSHVLDVALLLIADRTSSYLASSYYGARTLALRSNAGAAAMLDGCRRDLLEGSDGMAGLISAALLESSPGAAL